MPNNVEVMLKLARVLFKEQNNIEDAISYLKRIIQIQPNNDEALILLGKILDKSGKHAEAAEILESAIKAQAQSSRGKGSTTDKSTENYSASGNNHITLKASAFFYLGNSYEKLKEYKKCVLNYKKCLTLDNKHFGACIHLANLLANLGEGQRAAKYFKHAIRIDPESINAHFGLGKAL